jgi:hypothetical protein
LTESFVLKKCLLSKKFVLLTFWSTIVIIFCLSFFAQSYTSNVLPYQTCNLEHELRLQLYIIFIFHIKIYRYHQGPIFQKGKKIREKPILRGIKKKTSN